jgi:hypothetical protein
VAGDQPPGQVPGPRPAEPGSGAVAAEPAVRPGYVAAVALPGSRRLADTRLVRERVRTILAYAFAIAFLGTLGASFYGAIGPHWAQVKGWLLIILPVEAGLFGSALGYYFGSRSRS